MNIGYCKMGDNEIKSICKGLEKNTSITHINLGICKYIRILYIFNIYRRECIWGDWNGEYSSYARTQSNNSGVGVIFHGNIR